MTGRGRRRGLAALLAVPLLTLAACGSGGTPRPADDASSASPSRDAAADALARGTWLLRLDGYSGEDGETKRATYVALVPDTGKAVVVSTPRVPVAQVSGDQRALLVDAGHRWALADTRPAKADRTAGRVLLTDLTSGDQRRVDVAGALGRSGLQPSWVAFDPEKPGLLRGVSGQRVWQVDVTSRRGSFTGSLPTAPRPGWIYAGGFDKNTGRPYVEDTGSFDTRPAGNGDDDDRAIERGGGTLLVLEHDLYGKLPDPGCDASTGYRDDTGGAWAFCVGGGHVRVRHLADGAEDWTDVGTTTAGRISGDPVLVLPPVGG